MKYFLPFLMSTVLLFSASEDDNNSLFFDPVDGAFDVSGYLSEAYGFLPMPTLLTEPALGYGAALSLLYLHDNLKGTQSESGRNIPPSISGVVVAGTENGTKAGGAFHKGHWKEDSIRTTSVAFYGDVNIDVYPVNFPKIGINGKGAFLYQSVKFRVMESDFFLGSSYSYGSTTVKLNEAPPLLENLNDTTKTGALALLADYDTRDNVFSPNDGMLLSVQASFFNKAFGGDDNFERYKLQGLFYTPLDEKWFVDLKVHFEGVSDEGTPFYMYPYIDLRGIPMMRYQAQNSLVSEVQLRYEVTERWSVLAFGGAGKAYGGDPFTPLVEESFSEAETRYSKGLGFRYLIAKKYGLRMGIDVASSKEDKAVYIQFGTAWVGL